MTKCAVDPGDTAWVLVATVLVLGMVPALALFEAGLLRSKNSLSVVFQVFAGLTANSILWVVVGYTLTFGPTVGGVIGRPDHVMMAGLSYTECVSHAPSIPSFAYATFMMMFAAITPLLMTGAYAERVGTRASLVLSVAWEVLVYYPVAHWVWGGGWLWTRFGVQDFAGGIVIHTTAGVASLVIVHHVGRRRGADEVHGEFPPSNVPMATVGAALLWVGWFGFNAGSALGANAQAVGAVVATQVGASASALAWMVLSWWRTGGKPSVVAILNGGVAGLAGITPASGYVSVQSAFGIGVALGVTSFYLQWALKHRTRLDDALDVSVVHGWTGVLGSLSIGFCGSAALDAGARNGLFYGGGGRLLADQLLGVVVAAAWSAVWTKLIMLGMDLCFVVRVDDADEDAGLDASEHDENAYHNLRNQRREPLYKHLLEEHGNYEEAHALARNIQHRQVSEMRDSVPL